MYFMKLITKKSIYLQPGNYSIFLELFGDNPIFDPVIVVNGYLYDDYNNDLTGEYSRFPKIDIILEGDVVIDIKGFSDSTGEYIFYLEKNECDEVSQLLGLCEK